MLFFCSNSFLLSVVLQFVDDFLSSPSLSLSLSLSPSPIHHTHHLAFFYVLYYSYVLVLGC